jgi:hypothetical protein
VQQRGGVDELDGGRKLEALRPSNPSAFANSSTSMGRMRLPPALMM